MPADVQYWTVQKTVRHPSCLQQQGWCSALDQARGLDDLSPHDEPGKVGGAVVAIQSSCAPDRDAVPMEPANDTFQEIEEAAKAYARECILANPREPALAELVRHIIACGDGRPIGFWVAAIEEAVELDSQRCCQEDHDD